MFRTWNVIYRCTTNSDESKYKKIPADGDTGAGCISNSQQPFLSFLSFFFLASSLSTLSSAFFTLAYLSNLKIERLWITSDDMCMAMRACVYTCACVCVVFLFIMHFMQTWILGVCELKLLLFLLNKRFTSCLCSRDIELTPLLIFGLSVLFRSHPWKISQSN